MRYDEDELKIKVKSILRKYKVKYRSISITEDKIIIGVEGSKSDYPVLVRKLSSIGLQKVNIVYGRWVFKYNMY